MTTTATTPPVGMQLSTEDLALGPVEVQRRQLGRFLQRRRVQPGAELRAGAWEPFLIELAPWESAC